MRILEILKKYDDSITVKELISVITNEQKELELKDIAKFYAIKETYNNSYLKRYDEGSIYGGTLEIYYIREITDKEKTQEWDDLYAYVGTMIKLSKKYINIIEIEADCFNRSFTKAQLDNMEKISLEDYNKYLNQFTTIQQTLGNIR